MTEIRVTHAAVKVKVVALTTRILKQVRHASHREAIDAMKAEKDVIGWFCGEAIGLNGKTYILFEVGGGDLRIFNVHPESAYKFPQLYI